MSSSALGPYQAKPVMFRVRSIGPPLANDLTRCNPFLALVCISAVNVGGGFSFIPADEDVGHCQENKKVYWRQAAEFCMAVPGTCPSSDVGKVPSVSADEVFTCLQS